MNQTEKRLFLIRSLLDEQPEYRMMEIPAVEAEQKRILRSLFNIRMPGEISDVNVPQNVTVNKTKQAVFALLREHTEFTRDKLAEKTSKTIRTIQRTVDSLRERGI